MRKNTETVWLHGALCLIDDNNIITVYGGPLVSSCETGQALHWTNQYIPPHCCQESTHYNNGGGGVITILSLVLPESLLTELEA